MIKIPFSSTTHCRKKKTTKLEMRQTSSSQCNKTDSNAIAAKLLNVFYKPFERTMNSW
jgi:hypothetical protein